MASSQLPLWLQYIQAVGPSLVAVVVGLVAASIAYRQWRTADDALRLNLFAKRYAIYLATRQLIDKATIHGGVHSNDIRNFTSQIGGAEFLFEGETRDFVMRVRDRAANAAMTLARVDRAPAHPNADKLIDAAEDHLKWLRDQDQRIEAEFRPFLDLSKAGLRRRRW